MVVAAWALGLDGRLRAALAGGTADFLDGYDGSAWSKAGADRLAMAGYALAVLIGGIGIFPRAARNLMRLRFDIDVLMGLAILGAMAWDNGTRPRPWPSCTVYRRLWRG